MLVLCSAVALANPLLEEHFDLPEETLGKEELKEAYLGVGDAATFEAILGMSAADADQALRSWVATK